MPFEKYTAFTEDQKMNEFIVIRRLAKNDDWILVHTMDIRTKSRSIMAYNQEDNSLYQLKEIIESFTTETILSDFVDFDTEEPLSEKILNDDLKPCTLNVLSDISMYQFDPDTPPSIRTMTYSFKRGDQLFIPCCGKNPDHWIIKETWGRYINDFQLTEDNIQLEGYIVTNPTAFDHYVLRITDEHFKVRHVGNSKILLSEFRDYIESLRDGVPKIILRYEDGEEIEMELE